MSRYVNVSDTEYKITVKDNGTIILDTGYDPTGNNNNQPLPRPPHTVVVTGDLLVLGETTTVSTTDLIIEDNMIVLNYGDTSTNGITAGYSGIEINRGTSVAYPTVRLVFDEITGTFSFRDINANLVGIQTNLIKTDSANDLTLIGSGIRSVNVAGTDNYELNIGDDDDIPNIKWTKDWTAEYFNLFPPEFIKKGDSILRIYDSQYTAETVLQLKLDNVVAAEFKSYNFTVQDISVVGSIISSTASNSNLTLTAPGTGNVVVDDILKINLSTVTPTNAADGIRIYSKNESFGGTGIFFVNTKSTKDELASRRKALAYSMIF